MLVMIYPTSLVWFDSTLIFFPTQYIIRRYGYEWLSYNIRSEAQPIQTKELSCTMQTSKHQNRESQWAQ